MKSGSRYYHIYYYYKHVSSRTRANGASVTRHNTLQTVMITDETFLFYGRNRRRVLPERTCNLQTRDAMSRHARPQ